MAIGRQNSIFKYKTIHGPLHKLPAIVKMIFIWPLSIFCMTLSSLHLIFGITIAALTAFICKFSIREQLTDLKLAFFYGILMYALSLLSAFLDLRHLFPDLSFLDIVIPKSDFVRIVLRLVLIMQLSALLFRSTSTSEIRHGLPFAKSLTLFICFIPEIFETWSSINHAWKARGGKQGFSKIKTIVFVLITLSMERAAVKAKAIAARS